MKQHARRMLALAGLLAVLSMPYLRTQMQAAESEQPARPEVPRAFSISGPTSNRPISGTCGLTVAFSNKSIASVEYLLGSKRLGIAVKPPFELRWNTAYAADGSSAIEAVARDSFGNKVAATERIFTLANYGNFITATTPDLARPLQGIVTVTVSGEDSRYYPAEWLAYLDGEQMAGAWTDNSASTQLRLPCVWIRQGSLMASTNCTWPCIQTTGNGVSKRKSPFTTGAPALNGWSISTMATL